VAWSRDGKTLAMVNHIVAGGSWGAGIPMDGRLVAYDIATAQETPLSPPGTNVSVKEPYSWTMSGSHSPVWSADGQWLAYRRSESARREGQEPEYRQEVWIVRRDGTDARKVLNHGASALAWTPGGKALLWVSEGRFGRIEPEIDTTALGPTPAAPAGAFTIHGRVTGADGQPMPGVEVRVARGMGTLHSTTPVATDADGRYEIHFGPAVFSAGGPNMQAACVFAHKPGYYEKDLCQAGNLGMANYQPEGDGAKGWGFAGIVYPGHPYRLDFTMLPAATVSVRLVDREGNPLAKHRLYLAGADLYPASSVLAGGETDAEGRMDLESVPLKTYHFSLTAGRAEINSDPIPFDTPAPLHFRLTYDDIAGTLTAERE
jgi:hypothetical protein